MSELKNLTINELSSSPNRVALNIDTETGIAFKAAFNRHLEERPELKSLNPGILNGILFVDMSADGVVAFDELVGNAIFQVKHQREQKGEVDAFERLETKKAIDRLRTEIKKTDGSQL